MKSLVRHLKKGAAIVLSLAGLSVPGIGSPRTKPHDRGADLLVQKKDGTFLRGELLGLEGRALILLEAATGNDVAVAIDDVDAFKIFGESGLPSQMTRKFLWVGAPVSGLGLLLGVSATPALVDGAVVGGIAAIIKGFLSGAKREGQIAVLRDVSAARKDLALGMLKGMALFSGPPPTGYVAAAKERRMGTKTRPGRETYSDLTSGHIPRLHLSFEPSWQLAQGDSPYVGMFLAMGFGDTKPASSFWGLSFPAKRYPVGERTGLSLRGARLEYSLTRSIAIGFSYASMGDGRSTGYRLIPLTRRGSGYHSEVYVSESRSGAGYFFTAAWMPVPDGFFNLAALKLGVEIGACAVRHHFGTSEGGGEVAGRRFARTVPAAGVFGELDLYSGRVMSVGLRAVYRYARSNVKAFVLDGTYLYLDENNPPNFLHRPITISFPAHKVDFGGPTIGMSLGLHL